MSPSLTSKGDVSHSSHGRLDYNIKHEVFFTLVCLYACISV